METINFYRNTSHDLLTPCPKTPTSEHTAVRQHRVHPQPGLQDQRSDQDQPLALQQVQPIHLAKQIRM